MKVENNRIEGISGEGSVSLIPENEDDIWEMFL